MAQRTNDAAIKDAQTMPSVFEYSSVTGQIATQTMNLLHLDQNTTRLQLNPYPNQRVFLEMPSEDKRKEAS
jgi:hypothetical protein